MRALKKKFLSLCGIGFLFGIAFYALIAVLFYRTEDGSIQFYSDFLLPHVGSPAVATLLTFLIFGLYVGLNFGGTVLYELEDWTLLKATVVHYLIVSVGYLVPVLLLGWKMSMSVFLIIEGLMTVGFFLIWLIMYLRYKAEVKELNMLIGNTKQTDQNTPKNTQN